MADTTKDQNDDGGSGLQETKAAKGTLGTLQSLLDKYKDQIATALPNHLTPERMIRVALTAVSKSHLLQRCDPRTIAGCIVQSSLLGLECDGALGEGYLVPFWNKKANNNRGGYECQFMPGYQGIIKLVRNTGELVTVDSHSVYEADDFDYSYGFEPMLLHKPAKGARGKIVGYWAAAVLKGGGKQFVYWTVEEIDDHRDKYSKGAYKTDRGKFVLDAKGNKILQGPWADSPDWMYKKTVIRQLAKLLPKSAQAQLAIALDEAHNAGIAQRFQVEVPLDLQPTPTDEDEADIASRVAAQTAATGADLGEKLRAQTEEGKAEKAAADSKPEGDGSEGKKVSTKTSSKKSSKAAASKSASSPEEPAHLSDRFEEGSGDAPPPGKKGSSKAAAAVTTENYPKFEGEAQAKNLQDMPKPEHLSVIYSLAKKKGVVPSKVAKALYGINTDELGIGAAEHFKGYLETLPDKDA